MKICSVRIKVVKKGGLKKINVRSVGNVFNISDRKYLKNQKAIEAVVLPEKVHF